MHTWWVDEPLVMASSNPSGEDLARLRSQGFSVVISFLDERKEPPKYDRRSAAAAGWTTISIPIEEGGVPSPDELSEFRARMRAWPEGMKILMHCESGLGRTPWAPRTGSRKDYRRLKLFHACRKQRRHQTG
jgi:protein tyrosine phosphatase (PTP) superfamily phosphohydrolase (DUF442 family)